MGFVLPYTDVSLEIAEIAPIFDAYPELGSEIQSLLEDRFDYDGDETWNVNLPELALEATFEPNSVTAEIDNEWNFEINWDEGELNLDWSGPGEFFEDFDLSIGSISQQIALAYDLFDLSASAEVTTSADGDSMTDEVEVSAGFENGVPSFAFEWNHSGDDQLFDVPSQSVSVELETSASGDCDFSSNGLCNADAVMTIEYNNVEEEDYSATHTATFVSKPRIAWATYQIDDGKHFVIGVRAENEDGKSSTFQSEHFVSVWYKAFDSTYSRPGRVANNKMGTNVATFPLTDGLEHFVFPVLDDVLAPFLKLGEAISENPETIPNFAVYFDLWCEELPDELGLASVVEASRISVWGVSNEVIQEIVEEFDATFMEETFKQPVISEVWEECREFVQELFGEEGQEVFEDTYLN